MQHLRVRLIVAVSLLAFPAAAQESVPSELLPRDLTIGSMFHDADNVVRTVLIGLVLASVATWTILLAKAPGLLLARRAVRRAQSDAEEEATLAAVQSRLPAGSAVPRQMVDAALTEMRLSDGTASDGIKDRVASRLSRLEAAAGRRISYGTGLLATIGATAPFVGLFGTVWGIMNSFIGISQSQTTNLAIVAPGIAQALLATATGLIAAIPAVVIYNFFARSIGGYRALLGDFSAAVLRLVSRELDQRTVR
jgi:biopolymer transport protein ExbB